MLPYLNYTALEGRFNWTMALRGDADIEVVHRRTVKLESPVPDWILKRERRLRKNKHDKFQNDQEANNRLENMALA